MRKEKYQARHAFVPEEKKRFVLYKSKKKWVVKSLVFGVATTVGVTAVQGVDVSDLLERTLGIEKATKQATDKLRASDISLRALSSTQIDQLTDSAQVGESHSLTLSNADFTTANFTGTSSSSNPVVFLNNLSNTTSNTKGVSLIPYTTNSTNKEGAGVTGAIAFNQQIDMTKSWSMVGNFDLTSLNTYGPSPTGPGEFLGLILSPTQPNKLATGQGGGGLGIQGLASTVTWGIDLWDEASNQNDSGYNSVPSPYFGDTVSVNGTSPRNPGTAIFGGAASQVVGFRETDASGKLVAAQSNDPNRRVMGSLSSGETNGTGNNFQNDNGGTGNKPYIIRPFAISYTYNGNGTGTLTATVNGWNLTDTGASPATNGTYVFTKTVNLVSNSMSVGFSATSGTQFWAQMGLDLTSFQIQLGTGTTVVNYLDQNGNPLRAQTQFIANTTDTIGIQGTNVGASDTYDFTAPTFTGYSLVPRGAQNSTDFITVASDNVNSSGVTTAGNTLNVQYQADNQQAPLNVVSLTPNVVAPFTPPTADANNQGVSNAAISFVTTDAQLNVPGYTYTVLGPDGKTYNTLSQALSANPSYDATSNGYNATTDAQAQPFTVQYTADSVTLQYAMLDNNGVLTDKTSAIQPLDTSTPTNPTIGQVLTSQLYTDVSTPATLENVTTLFQNHAVIPQGYHLTGTTYWNDTNDTFPTTALDATDVVANGADTYKGTLIFQYAPDFQEATVVYQMDVDATGAPYPLPLNGLPAPLIQTGVSGASFAFTTITSVPSGWHITKVVQPDGTSSVATRITGTFDNTNNGNAQTDSATQNYTVYLAPDTQTLNLNYQMPQGYSLPTGVPLFEQAYSNQNFGSVAIYQIPGYTSAYQSLQGGQPTPATEIPSNALLADTTSNWDAVTGVPTTIDNTPQTVQITYTADARKITLDVDGAITEITTGADGHAYATDTPYDAVVIPQKEGFTSYVSVNGGAAQYMTGYPSGTFSTADITLNVTYSSWRAQVQYYTQEVASDLSTIIGALSPLKTAHASQTGGAGSDFTQNLQNGGVWVDTSTLVAEGSISQGYHISNTLWSQKPDGTTTPLISAYTNNWTWDDLTNIGTGPIPQYQAAIVYQYTADVQQAGINIIGAPNGSGITNGANTLDGMGGNPYTGTTDGAQVVTVPKINGYLVKVTDSSGNEVNLVNSTFTITYDNTANGINTTDATPQNYTITYIAQTANILVNYTYANTANTNVAPSASQDTQAYTAPTLANQVAMTTQTGESYTVQVPDVSGYTWTITDSNGNSYTNATLPKTFTSDGTNVTYTVSYAPTNATHTLYFYEATYDASGNFTYTTNPVSQITPNPLITTGVIGSLQSFGVSSANISVPNGWELDPMKASLGSVTDTTGAGDNDNLNGGSSAKEWTYTPGNTDYIVYLARSIQSVQVNFVGDPNGTATLYHDGRTGETFNVDTTNFARSGYTYQITDATGTVVNTISGTYDATNNKNAGMAIKNNGDGDSSPQVYTVTYTPDFQQANLICDATNPVGGAQTLEQVTGVTNGAIAFATTDEMLAINGYYYTVCGPSGKNYASLAQALAAIHTFDNTDNIASTDSETQTYTVTYYASMQQAILQTDTSDPTGVQLIETVFGVTGGKILFDAALDTTLARSGYTYTISDGTHTYASVNDLDNAGLVYDSTNNGQTNVDTTPQHFTVSYTALSQTVNINYVYSATDGDDRSGQVPESDFGGQTVITTQTKVTNATGDTINVPTLTGYVPNVTQVVPNFAVNSDGTLVEPTITVTYSAKPETALLTYASAVEMGGVITVQNDLTTFALSSGAPSSLTGVMQAPIFSQGVAPSVAGYTIIGYQINGGTPIATDGSGLENLLYTDGANNLTFLYQANEQTVAIAYVYSAGNNNSLAGEIVDPSAFNNTYPAPTSAISTSNQTVNGNTSYTLDQNAVVNSDGSFNTPILPGYVANVATTKPSFAIDSSGNLTQPTLTITYVAQNQVANIQYSLANSRDAATWTLSDAGTLVNGAPTKIQGVTGQVVPFSSATAINGYAIYGIKDANGNYIQSAGVNVCDPTTLSIPFSATSSQNNYEIVYEPNEQNVTVHYVYQLPAGYSGTYDGNLITYDANNNQEVANVPTQAFTAFTNAPTTLAPVPPAAQTGWVWTPATAQNIDWTTIDATGQVLKTDYYYYLAPVQDNLNVAYMDSNNNSLLPYINEALSKPILNASTLSGQNWLTSGAIGIIGYDYQGYVVNPTNLTVTTTNTTDDTIGPASANSTITYQYQASTQKVAISYQYADSNNQPTGRAVTFPSGSVQPQSLIGVSNQSASASYTVENTDGSTISQTGNVDVPTLKGYTANTTQIAPNFTVDFNTGQLVQPTLYVIYQANTDNSATLHYQSTQGTDLSQKAVDANGNGLCLDLSATGSTDAVIYNSSNPMIPGYTLEHVWYTPYNGTRVDVLNDTSQAVFSGSETGGADDVTFEYAPIAQRIQVNYVYQTGGKATQTVVPTQVITGTTDLTGGTLLSNGTLTSGVGPIIPPTGAQLAGYTLVTADPQEVNWTVNNKGNLFNPLITFDYVANQSSALINYGTSSVSALLNPLVPSGVNVATQVGLTDATIPLSGPVSISGYTFTQMTVNGNSVATDVNSAKKVSTTFSPNAQTATNTTINYVYTANNGTTTYQYVDTAGNLLNDQMVDNTTYQTGAEIVASNTTAPLITGYTIQKTQVNGVDTSSVITGYPTMPQTDVATVIYTYQANAEEARVVFVDTNGVSIQPPQLLTGVTNQPIDYSGVNVAIEGYTLQTDGRQEDVNQRFGNTGNTQIVALVYSADTQVLVVNYWYATDKTGVQTWKKLQPSQNLVGVSNQPIVYPQGGNPDVAGYAAIQNEMPQVSNFDAQDAADQVVNVYFAPYEQVAVMETDSTDPENANGTIIRQTQGGYSYGAIGFSTASDDTQTHTDSDLERKGYGYLVYAPDFTWYPSLSQAIASNAVYDTNVTQPLFTSVVRVAPMNFKTGVTVLATLPRQKRAPLPTLPPISTHLSAVQATATGLTPTNPPIAPNGASTGAVADSQTQTFIANYTPSPESAYVQTTNDPSGNKVYPAVTGVTGGVMTTLNVGEAQTDSPSLFRSGYAYQVTAPNGTIYANLAQALAANNVFDDDTTTNQVFTVTYRAQMQTAQIVTDATDPKGGKVQESEQGASNTNISFTKNDSNLYREGYSYKVTGPDGTVYDSLQEALQANATYDATALNTDGTDPVPQLFTVTYTPYTQTVEVKTSGNPDGDRTLEVDMGKSDTAITLTTTDSQLVVLGFAYKVLAPNGQTYDTLKAAQLANPTYDHNDATGTTDNTPQIFTIIYTGVKQVVNVVANGGQNNGKIIATTTGASLSKISLSDASVHQSGYTYTITAPNGKTYPSMAEALKENATFDRNDLTNGVDKTPQIFTANLTPVKQNALLTTAGRPNGDSTLANVYGNSNAPIDFGISEASLVQSGYTYVVIAPNGISYPSLQAALLANPTYDTNDLTNGVDKSPQVFRVLYTKSTSRDEAIKEAIKEDLKDANLSEEVKNQIVQEVLEQFNHGASGTGFIEDILKHLAPEMTDAQRKAYALKIWRTIQNNLPNNGAVHETWMRLAGTLLTLSTGVLLWTRRKKD